MGEWRARTPSPLPRRALLHPEEGKVGMGQVGGFFFLFRGGGGGGGEGCGKPGPVSIRMPSKMIWDGREGPRLRNGASAVTAAHRVASEPLELRRSGVGRLGCARVRHV